MPSKPINVGMAAGAAVGLTLGVLFIAAGAVFYVRKFGNPFGNQIGSISNPIETIN